MSRARGVTVCRSLAALLLLSAFAPAQNQTPSPNSLRGSVIEHPEEISGAWEVKADHTIYGLQIALSTKVEGTPASLSHAHQTVQSADIQVYQRNTPVRKAFDGNWFTDQSPSLRWSGRHLYLDQPPSTASPRIKLDLLFDPKNHTWSGDFQRGSFSRFVTLRRPQPNESVARNPIAGTWQRPGQMNNCIHIVQTETGSLEAWYDDLETPGSVRYANGLQPPKETFEVYGSIAKVERPNPRIVHMEFKVFSAMCCSVSYIGRLSPDATMIQSSPGDGGNWRRMQGGSCIKN